MINTIQQKPNISQHKRILNSSISSQRSMSNSACVKNEIKREPAEVNFCGFFKPETIEKFCKSNKLHKVLEFAEDQPLVFGAGFALILTCILRPLSIVLLPSKKNKEDQKYASAHSIASGLIGFAISTILFLPIGKAVKKIKEAPNDFTKEGSYLKNKDMFKTAKALIDRTPDLITAIPKGILTIALIPPILKYCFGIEKKKHNGDKNEMAPSVDYSLLNFKSSQKQNKIAFQNSMGGVK